MANIRCLALLSLTFVLWTLPAKAASVVCLGDSITYGYVAGGRLTNPYPLKLQSLMNNGTTVTNAGASGETTAQMKTRWDGGLKTGGYGTLVFLGGVNDIANSVPLATTQANIHYIWMDALSRGIRVVALTVTPWRGDTLGGTDTQQTSTTNTLNAWIRSEAATYGIKVVDLYQTMGGQSGDPATLLATYDSGDHIHPNQAGADFIASSVYSVISQPFTVTKHSGNPVLTPNSGNDAQAVRDAAFLKTGATYNIVYTGFRSDYSNGWVEVMLATSSSPTGPFTRSGIILPDLGPLGSNISPLGPSDPWPIYANGKWYCFFSFAPSDTVTNGTRAVGYYTANGTADGIPTTGWVLQNPMLLKGMTTGYTSNGAGGITGVSAPKIIPKVDGGWIMFFAAWGSSMVNQYQVGYATASALEGPWTIGPSLIGTPGGYQAEQITPFQYNGRHYLICNRLGLDGKNGPGFPNLGIDLWEADSQTGPYTLAQQNFIPRGTTGAWDSKDMGVTGLLGYDANDGTLYGVYDANNIGGAEIARSIGAFTITAPAISATPAASSSTMSASFR